MDRRKFLATSASLAAMTGHIDWVDAAELDPSITEVRSPNLTLTPQSSDQWELALKPSRPFRILQVTDTHFSSSNEDDNRSVRTLNALIRSSKPDLIVHTGDFVNNDSEDTVTWLGVEYFNQLRVPWALCFGNHDYPVHQARGSLTLDEFRRSLKNCAMGFAEIQEQRHYCYRHDLKGMDEKPAATLCYFQVGYAGGDRKISDPQLAWFAKQILTDLEKGWDHPILVFVHIPLVEYNMLVTSGKAAGGFKNEDVCFDSDTGASFKAFAASNRVKGVFCGHDHVNNYFGNWEGIGLHYGRVSGWGGYGKWARGGRLILVNPANGQFTHREVVV
jgi:3',5'-cyclic AMP phosphodiesterase CpdA